MSRSANVSTMQIPVNHQEAVDLLVHIKNLLSFFSTFGNEDSMRKHAGILSKDIEYFLRKANTLTPTSTSTSTSASREVFEGESSVKKRKRETGVNRNGEPRKKSLRNLVHGQVHKKLEDNIGKEKFKALDRGTKFKLINDTYAHVVTSMEEHGITLNKEDELEVRVNLITSFLKEKYEVPEETLKSARKSVTKTNSPNKKKKLECSSDDEVTLHTKDSDTEDEDSESDGEDEDEDEEEALETTESENF